MRRVQLRPLARPPLFGSERASDADYVAADAAAPSKRGSSGSSKSSVKSKVSSITTALIDANVPPRFAPIFAAEGVNVRNLHVMQKADISSACCRTASVVRWRYCC